MVRRSAALISLDVRLWALLSGPSGIPAISTSRALALARISLMVFMASSFQRPGFPQPHPRPFAVLGNEHHACLPSRLDTAASSLRLALRARVFERNRSADHSDGLEIFILGVELQIPRH